MDKNLKFLTKIKVKFKKVYRKLNKFWEVFQNLRKFKIIFEKLMKNIVEKCAKTCKKIFKKISAILANLKLRNIFVKFWEYVLRFNEIIYKIRENLRQFY